MEQSQDKQETATSYEQVVAEVAKAKSDPNYVPQLPEGYVLDAEMPDGVYRVRPCLEEFMAAGYPREDYDKRFGGPVEAGKEAWGPPWSNPNWRKPTPNGLPDTLHVVSQVRRVGTRTARATAPTKHRFKQYLFGDPSHRLVRNRRIVLNTGKVLDNIDELITKEQQGILSVHHADGRRVDLQALKDMRADDVFGAPRLASPPPNFPLDSIANDTPAGIPYQTFIDGTFDGDVSADRALASMRADKASELGEETEPFVDPASEEAHDEQQELSSGAEGVAEEAAANTSTTEVTEEKPAESEVSATADTQLADRPAKHGKKGKR